MKLVHIFLALGVIAVTASITTAPAKAEPVMIRLGYFEGGEHPIHVFLRDEFERQLAALAPEDTQFVFVPEGYRSASWIRDTSRVMAAQLVGVETVDIMVAYGPWVVEDLLAAGYDRPILAMRQLDPIASGLADSTGRPVAGNLTVHIQAEKIERDVAMLSQLMDLKRLGVLLFPANEAEREGVLQRIRSVGRQAGFEVETAEGSNMHGTFAFFKAYNALPKDLDAVYLGPLWGMDITKVNEFLKMTRAGGTPAFTWEGRFLVTRGALASRYGYGMVAEAFYNARKTLSMARGEKPDSLPTVFSPAASLVINEETALLTGVDIPFEALISGSVVSSPQPEGAEPYTVTDAVARAAVGNPGFLATYDRLDQAASAAAEAAAAYRPRLRATASAGYLDDNTLNNTVEPLDNEQFRAGLQLEQQLLSLETIRGIQRARHERALAEIDQHQARLDLERAVAAAYLDYQQAIEKMLVEQRYQEVVERSLERAAARFHLAGEGQADLVRWQDERQQALVRLLEARNTLQAARAIFHGLLNLPEDVPVRLVDTLATPGQLARDYMLLAPLAVKGETRASFESALLQAAHESSPTMLRYDRRLALQHSRLAENKARFWPSLDLHASVNLSDEINDNLGVIDEKHDTWSVFARLNLPLYLGGERFKERSRLKAGLSELEFRRDAAGIDLSGKLHQRTGRMAVIAASLPRLARSRELVVQNLELTVEAYESGRRDVTALIETYRHARDTELKEIESRFSYLKTMAALVTELGWSSSNEYVDFYTLFHRRVDELLAR